MHLDFRHTPKPTQTTEQSSEHTFHSTTTPTHTHILHMVECEERGVQIVLIHKLVPKKQQHVEILR